MAITVEYLAILRQADSFCDSAVSFTTLLMVNSKIRVSGEEIRYEGERACRFQLFSGEIAEKRQRYFHLPFTWDGNPDGAPEPLARFQSLLKAVRAAISHGRGEVETLWNELSAHCACKVRAAHDPEPATPRTGQLGKGLPNWGNDIMQYTGPRTRSWVPQIAAKCFSWSIFQDSPSSAAVVVEASPVTRNTPEVCRCKD
jgi:hypothetical protein